MEIYTVHNEQYEIEILYFNKLMLSRPSQKRLKKIAPKKLFLIIISACNHFPCCNLLKISISIFEYISNKNNGCCCCLIASKMRILNPERANHPFWFAFGFQNGTQ